MDKNRGGASLQRYRMFIVCGILTLYRVTWQISTYGEKFHLHWFSSSFIKKELS